MSAKKKVMVGKNPQDDTERISLDMLCTLLHRSRLATVQRFDDKKEHIDGMISFFTADSQPLFIEGENGARGYMFPHILYQAKGTIIAGTHHYDCDRRFLHRAFFDKQPILMIFADTTNNVLYYEYLSRAYIVENLGIADITTETRNEIRMTFLDAKILTNPQQLVDGFLEEAIRLEGIDTYGASTTQEIKNHKDSIRGIMNKDVGVVYDLEALLFYNFPVKITEVDKITALCDKLSISNKEFDYMIEVLIQVGALQIMDDLVTIIDVKVAQTLLDDLITRRGMDYIL